jgi:3-hydroxy-9,10-secoandrosta-1,3,5(10)-triene-9,17-dione monooxygenase
MPNASEPKSTTPTLAEMKERARRLMPGLRERQQKTETLRRVPEESLTELHAAGLFRIHQPARVGGSELPFRAIVEIGSIVAQGCASTAWVLTNLISHHWMLGYFPRETQDEVWSKDPDQLIGSAFIFTCGKAKRVSGGYRISGRWPFSSGVDPSNWLLVGALVEGEADTEAAYRMFLVPVGSWRVLDTWHVMGLVGTGSHDIVIDDVFVPERRSLAMSAVRGGAGPWSETNPGALYRLPMMALFAYVVGAVPLGIAQGTLEQFTTAMKTRLGTYSGKSLADLPTLQIRIAEAGALAAAGEALMLRGCDEATGFAEAQEVPPIETKARWRRDGAYAAHMCGRAVDLLFTGAGGGAIYQRNPLQRAFRDVHAALGHQASTWDVQGTLYGRVALGLPPEVPNL